jgi:hypothetical protein
LKKNSAARRDMPDVLPSNSSPDAHTGIASTRRIGLEQRKPLHWMD